MKIRPVEAELFHAEGRTDTTKLIGAFGNFANAPRIILIPTVTSELLQNVTSSGRLRLPVLEYFSLPLLTSQILLAFRCY